MSRRPQYTAGAVVLALLVAVGFALVPVPSGSAQGTTAKKTGRHKVRKEDKLYVEDTLTADLPKYRSRPSYYKAYKYPMKAGVTYTIDMMKRDPGGLADPYLYLEDPKGVLVAQDDDSGGNLNARIVYRAPRTGNYRIVAASYRNMDMGNYVISARPGGTVGMFGRGVGPVEQHFGDITITLEPQPANFSGGGGNEYGHGYVEYRFNVENESETDSHRVTISFPQTRGYSSGPCLSAVSRTVEVGPDASATVSLLQPDLSSGYGGGAAVTIDGQKRFTSFNINVGVNRGQRYSGQYGSAGTVVRQILTGANLSMRLQGNVYKTAVGRPVGGPMRPMGGVGSQSGSYVDPETHKMTVFVYYGVNRFLQAPATASWSTNWLAYSSYDGIVLYPAELEGAPPGVQKALRRYVECGGCLVLLGKTKLPGDWRKHQSEADGITTYYPGLGQCLVMPDAQVEKWVPKQWHQLADGWERSAQPWQHVRTVTQANDDFPVVANLGIPVRSLFLLMFVFAIVIGPVNLYVLSRKKRRIWMLWTVPAISFVTCLGVLGYMLLSEGWQGHSRAEGLTVLDEGTRRASTVGWVGYYTPFAPSDGLHFSPETELTPQLAFEPRHSYRPSSPRTLDWTEDQHLTSGWITARVPAYFSLRKSETRRERLALHREKDGALAVVNLLGADVGKVWLADRDGKVYTAEHVGAGARATLTPAGKTAGGEAGTLRDLYGKDWLQLYKTLTDRPEEHLRPGSYIATLEGAPFLDEGLPSARPRNSRSVVYGIMKEGADAS